MNTLSSLTDSGDSSRTDSPDPRAEADTESPASSVSPDSPLATAGIRAAALARAGLSALGAGLLALARGARLLARGGLVTGSVLGRGILVLGRGAAAAGRGTGKVARFAGARIRRWRIPERSGRAVIAMAATSALMGVRVWLVSRALLTSRTARAPRSARIPRGSRAARAPRGSRPSRTAPPARRSRLSQPRRSSPAARRSRPPLRLTARGGILVMFSTCFVGLLLSDWTDWAELADAVFFMASSLTAFYTRPGSLLPVAVSPPLLFFAALAAEKFVVASGTFAAFEGTLVILASAATWLFAGTALTLAIALLRGLPREIRALVTDLHR